VRVISSTEELPRQNAVPINSARQPDPIYQQKNLDGSEVDALMGAVYGAVAKAGREVR